MVLAQSTSAKDGAWPPVRGQLETAQKKAHKKAHEVAGSKILSPDFESNISPQRSFEIIRFFWATLLATLLATNGRKLNGVPF